MIEFILNGGAVRHPAGTTVSDLVESLGLGGRRVAVEINLDIVPRTEHPERRLADGDRVEVVSFVGGG